MEAVEDGDEESADGIGGVVGVGGSGCAREADCKSAPRGASPCGRSGGRMPPAPGTEEDPARRAGPPGGTPRRRMWSLQARRASLAAAGVSVSRAARDSRMRAASNSARTSMCGRPMSRTSRRWANARRNPGRRTASTSCSGVRAWRRQRSSSDRRGSSKSARRVGKRCWVGGGAGGLVVWVVFMLGRILGFWKGVKGIFGRTRWSTLKEKIGPQAQERAFLDSRKSGARSTLKQSGAAPVGRYRGGAGADGAVGRAGAGEVDPEGDGVEPVARGHGVYGAVV